MLSKSVRLPSGLSPLVSLLVGHCVPLLVVVGHCVRLVSLLFLFSPFLLVIVSALSPFCLPLSLVLSSFLLGTVSVLSPFCFLVSPL